MECELPQGPHSLKRWTVSLHSEVLLSEAEVAQDDWKSVYWPNTQIRSNCDFLLPLKSSKGGKITGQQQGLDTLAEWHLKVEPIHSAMTKIRRQSTSNTAEFREIFIFGPLHSQDIIWNYRKHKKTQSHAWYGKSKSSPNLPQNFRRRDFKNPDAQKYSVYPSLRWCFVA